MHQNFLRWLGSIVIGVALTFVAGCSETKTTVEGKLVLPPNLKLVESDTVQVNLISEKENQPGVSGKAKGADLSFTCKDVTPGKYKVTVKIMAYPGMPESPKRAATFEATNQANDKANTKMSYEVTTEPRQSITVDAVKGTVTKS